MIIDPRKENIRSHNNEIYSKRCCDTRLVFLIQALDSATMPSFLGLTIILMYLNVAGRTGRQCWKIK